MASININIYINRHIYRNIYIKIYIYIYINNYIYIYTYKNRVFTTRVYLKAEVEHGAVGKHAD